MLLISCRLRRLEMSKLTAALPLHNDRPKSAMTEIPEDPVPPAAEPVPPNGAGANACAVGGAGCRRCRRAAPSFASSRGRWRRFSVLFLVLGIWVYRTSVGRFQIRKLRLPTRIYADITPLRTGQALQTDDLLEKLDRLGYSDVERLKQPGEFTRGDGGDRHLYARVHASHRRVSGRTDPRGGRIARRSSRWCRCAKRVRSSAPRSSRSCSPPSSASSSRTAVPSRCNRCRSICRTRSWPPRTCGSGTTPASIRSVSSAR